MSTLKTSNIQDTSGNNNSTPAEISNGRAKAWINFDGTTGTLNQNDVTIRDSFNVSSVTDRGTGVYQINFTTAMANTNYAIVISSGYDSAVYGVLHDSGGGTERAPTVNDFYVRFANSAGTQNNREYVCAAIFGD